MFNLFKILILFIFLVSVVYCLFAFVALNFWWIPVVDGVARFCFGIFVIAAGISAIGINTDVKQIV